MSPLTGGKRRRDAFDFGGGGGKRRRIGTLDTISNVKTMASIAAALGGASLMKRSQAKIPKAVLKKDHYRIQGLQKKVNKIVRRDPIATHTFRTVDTYIQISNAKDSKTVHYETNNLARTEAALANLRYYDPANPATLLTAAGGTGGQQKEFFIEKFGSKIEFRNTSQNTCSVRVYYVSPKGDTSIGPVDAIQSGVTDQNAGSYVIQSKLAFPTDSVDFNKMYKIRFSKVVTLPAGYEKSLSFNDTPYKYDPSLADLHALQYQPKWRCGFWLIRTESGIVDSATTGAGYGKTRLAIGIRTTFVIKYDAGAELNDYSVDATGIVNTGTLNTPVPTNTSYFNVP